jgi:LPXTG-site transpeptidase (sortase) family protein
MKKSLKILITTVLILILLLPLGYFVIYPNYNKVIGPIKRFDIQRSAGEITFQILTQLIPTEDKILGIQMESPLGLSIEESISKDTILENKILEELNTKIFINSIEVEGNIFEGIDSKTMNKGFWHFPTSNLPGQKGNSVIIGHRYAKLPPNKDTFFNLDKVKVGDKIEVVQLDQTYTYIVTDTKTVEKNDISILQNYSDYRITLITCSPLWSSDQRLVIIGKLDKLYKNT